MSNARIVICCYGYDMIWHRTWRSCDSYLIFIWLVFEP